jgi:hypothetical protein
MTKTRPFCTSACGWAVLAKVHELCVNGSTLVLNDFRYELKPSGVFRKATEVAVSLAGASHPPVEHTSIVHDITPQVCTILFILPVTNVLLSSNAVKKTYLLYCEDIIIITNANNCKSQMFMVIAHHTPRTEASGLTGSDRVTLQ